MKKTIIILSIVIVALIALLGVSNTSVFQGTTNLDSLGLSGDLTVAGASTVTGTSTVANVAATLLSVTGTSTLGNTVISNTGTSSLIINSSGTTTPATCIQMVTTSGSTSKMTFAGTSTITSVLSSGTCK